MSARKREVKKKEWTIGSKHPVYGTIVMITSFPTGIPGVIDRYYFFIKSRNTISMMPASMFE